MNKRDLTLDLAKGILIVLVVLGHSIQFSLGTVWTLSNQFYYDIVFKTIYSFHMPLFMLISGYLFYNSNKKDFKTLLPSKLKAIGIPMLSFILLCKLPSYAVLAMGGDIVEIIREFVMTIFCGMTMWFLMSLLLSMTIIAILTRVVKGRGCQYLGMLLLIVGSMFIPDTILLNVHKFMFPFFCIGYIIRQSNIDIYVYSKNKIAMGILTILSVAAICWFNRDTYIYTTGFCIMGDYANQLFIDCKRMIIALIVSYTFMQYMHILSVSNRTAITSKFVRFGQISLFIYGFNVFFDTAYAKVLFLMSINFQFNYIIPVVFTLCFIVISHYLYKLLEKNKITRAAFLGK